MSCSGCQTFKSLGSKKSPGTACPSSPHLSVTVPGMCSELCNTRGTAAGRALQEKCSGRRAAPLSCSKAASAPQHSTALCRGCSSACPTALLHLILTAFLHPIPTALLHLLTPLLCSILTTLLQLNHTALLHPTPIALLYPCCSAPPSPLRSIPSPLLCPVLSPLLCSIPSPLLCSIPVALLCPIPIAQLHPVPIALPCPVPTALLHPIPTALLSKQVRWGPGLPAPPPFPPAVLCIAAHSPAGCYQSSDPTPTSAPGLQPRAVFVLGRCRIQCRTRSGSEQRSGEKPLVG